jgi:hypothetical protein
MQHLSQHERATVSRTPKYYHALAEPHLYRNLVLSNNIDVVLLMLTILERHNLTQYIRSISPVEDERKWLYGRRSCWKLLEKAAEIKDLVKRAALPLHDDVFASRWKRSIFSLNRHVEGSLALLLALATNLEYLDLRHLNLNQDCSIMCGVLSSYWENDADYPLRKLRELRPNTDGGSVLVLPSMTTVRAVRCRGSYTDKMFRTPYGFQRTFTNLRVLELKHMHFEPASARSLIPHFHHLKQLKVRNTYHSIGVQHDFELLGHALVDHVRDLEVFEWSGYNHGLWEKHRISILPFGSLKALTRLTELAVDIQLLSGHRSQDLPPHLSNPSEYLPDGLKSLRITRVPYVALERLFSRCDKTTITVLIYQTTKVRSLSILEISMWMETWGYHSGYRRIELSQRSRYFMPKIVDVLAAMGTTLRIWCQGNLRADKLLYEPGFATTWPHQSIAEEILG